ncbi:MAG: response regulator [Pyrinomonadaceae bacterium]|nr:response regulator [Sphingobacteriaceae bacterium]
MVENPHIAVVDDDKIFHVLTKKILISTDFTSKISEFYDGQEALDYILENQNNPDNLPDIIFLDIQMPFLDGWQFLDQFITLTFNKIITVYIVSSSISTLDYQKSTTYNKVKGFIIKPFPRHKMIEVMEEYRNGM